MIKKLHSSRLDLVKSRHQEGSLAIVDDNTDAENYVVAYATLSGAMEEIMITKGSVVLVLEVRSSWVKILHGDFYCWVFTESLKKMNDMT